MSRFDALTLRMVAIAVDRNGAKAHRFSIIPNKHTFVLDGKSYSDVGGNFVCGFYGTLKRGSVTVGAKITLFREFFPAWNPILAFPGTSSTGEGEIRVLWDERSEGALVAGDEEWFLWCALLRADVDHFCIILDLSRDVPNALEAK